MQLVAYGAQDIYLTGNPQITFFKVVYRRHTNFSMEAIEQVFDQSPHYDGGALNCTISRSGDLITRLWLEVELPGNVQTGRQNQPGNTEYTYDNIDPNEALFYTLSHSEPQVHFRRGGGWTEALIIANRPNSQVTRHKYNNSSNKLEYDYGPTKAAAAAGHQDVDRGITDQDIVISPHNYLNWTYNTAHAFLKECEIEIGGQRIDKHYSQWMDIQTELTEKKSYNGLSGENVRLADTHIRHSLNRIFPQKLQREDQRERVQSIDLDPNPTSGKNKLILADLKMYIPLLFWFCENPGLALPLIALQYHDVKLKLLTRKLSDIVNIGKISRNCGLESVAGEDIDADGLQQGDKDRGDTLAMSDYQKNALAKLQSSSDYVKHPNNKLTGGNPVVKLYADYIFLDTDERRRFAQVSHEYLIEQVQRIQEPFALSTELNLNHPVKSIFWVVQDDNCVKERGGVQEVDENEDQVEGIKGADIYLNQRVTTRKGPTNPSSVAEGKKGALAFYKIVPASPDPSSAPATEFTRHGSYKEKTATDLNFSQGNDYFNYQTANTCDVEYIGAKSDSFLDGTHEAFKTATIHINNSERFTPRNASYFRTLQPLNSGYNIPNVEYETHRPNYIYMYSFALKPREHQPSGTCNFSRIDDAKLIFTTNQTTTNPGRTTNIFAVNYNILRIMSGMGGLAYSN